MGRPTISCVFGQQLWNLAVFTNFDMLFLAMGFISLVDEIQFMLISSRHTEHHLVQVLCLHDIYFLLIKSNCSSHLGKQGVMRVRLVNYRIAFVSEEGGGNTSIIKFKHFVFLQHGAGLFHTLCLVATVSATLVTATSSAASTADSAPSATATASKESQSETSGSSATKEATTSIDHNPSSTAGTQDTASTTQSTRTNTASNTPVPSFTSASFSSSNAGLPTSTAEVLSATSETSTDHSSSGTDISSTSTTPEKQTSMSSIHATCA